MGVLLESKDFDISTAGGDKATTSLKMEGLSFEQEEDFDEIIVEETGMFPEVMPVERLEDMNLKPGILDILQKRNISKLTFLQQWAIVPCISGRNVIFSTPPDCDCTRQKAFILAVTSLHLIDKSNDASQVLLLCSSVYRAVELFKLIHPLALSMDISCHLSVGHGKGMGQGKGMTSKDELDKLTSMPVQVVIGTPGRVWEMMYRNALKVSGIKAVLFDDGKLLFSPLFRTPIPNIMKRFDKPQIVISSTSADKIQCRDMSFEDFIVFKVRQEEKEVDLKKNFIYHIISKTETKESGVYSLFKKMGVTHAAVLTNHFDGAQEVVKIFLEKGYNVFFADSISKLKSRKDILKAFLAGPSGVLVAASSNIHLSEGFGLTLGIDPLLAVIYYDLPHKEKDLCNRCCATSNNWITVIKEKNKKRGLTKIRKLANDCGVCLEKFKIQQPTQSVETTRSDGDENQTSSAETETGQ